MPDTDTISILHLSDLHFGTEQNARKWHSQLADDLKIELACDRLDGVIISGDIAQKSEPKEYDEAKRFLELLCKEFGLEPDQLGIPPRARPGRLDEHHEIS